VKIFAGKVEIKHGEGKAQASQVKIFSLAPLSEN
jgi:hypothetical protein